MQEITIVQARLQNMLCNECWRNKNNVTINDLCNMHMCKNNLLNEDLKVEDKLCTTCINTCKEIVNGQSGWPKVKDACVICQEEMLAQAKRVQFPFKKIGRLTLKYNSKNKLEKICLCKC